MSHGHPSVIALPWTLRLVKRQKSPVYMLTETDKQLPGNWTRPESEYPRDLCVHEVFERQAEKSPDATALVFKDLRWTYRDLNSRANRIASHLRDFGVVRDSLVAVLMERSPETIAALLGILK